MDAVVEAAVDAFNALGQAERRVERVRGVLQNILNKLTDEQLAEYARRTEARE